jgi:DNA-binding transcriptional ArsR family regulator
MTDSVRVTDPQALRALSHPVRLRLLGLLRLEGPSTSTRLAQRLGESSGTTSYHLRELARYGFVDDAAELGSARERWWQATARMTTWYRADFAAAEGRQVVDELEHRLVEQRGRRLTAWLEQREALGAPWQAAADLSDWALRLTPQQSRQLSAELSAVLSRWAERHPASAPAEGSELVSVHVDVVPLRDWPV